MRVREKNSPSQDGCPGCQCALTDPSLQHFSEGHLCLGAKRMWIWDCPSVIKVFCIPQVVIQLHFLYFFPSLRGTDLTGNLRAEGKGWGSGAWCSCVVVGLFLHPDVLLLCFLHFEEVG